MKYAFIARYQQEYPVSLMCRVLEVSVSGYYAWKQRTPSQRQQEDERLSLRIQQVHQDSHQIYGSRRIRAELAGHGQSCGRKRVVRLMHKLGICSRPRRHRISTTDSQHTDPVAANLLDRDFTGVWTAEGWLYVAVVLDLFSRMVVGWAMARRHPAPGLLHHSDRGSQYTSTNYQVLLAQAGIQVSMSRKGNCYDNAAMESFIGSLKGEWTDRYSYQSFAEAQQSIFEYIEVFYVRSVQPKLTVTSEGIAGKEIILDNS
jgi:transposase InsO family protein